MTSASFKCRRCGWCCKNVNINVCYSDIMRWVREARFDILSKVSYINHKDSKKRGFYIAETVFAPKRACPFLTEKASCSVYETRPRCCSEFPIAHKGLSNCPALKQFKASQDAIDAVKKGQYEDFKKAHFHRGQLLYLITMARKQPEASQKLMQKMEIDPTEELWIESFTEDTGKTGWTTVGTDPWLEAQDQPTNYVWTTTKKAEIGDWDFADHVAGVGTINSVTLYVYGQNAVGRTLSFYIWDGTDWTEYTITMPTTWDWSNIAVPVLNTWAKIDGAKLYIKQPNQDDRTDIDAAYLLVDYTPTEYKFSQNLSVIGDVLPRIGFRRKILRPNANGYINAWPNQFPAAVEGKPEHWELVDDVTPDEDVTRIWTSETDSSVYRDAYELPDQIIPVDAVFSQIEVVARVLGGVDGAANSPNLKILIYTPGEAVQEYDKGDITETSYVEKRQVITTNPWTGQPWTKEDIDNLQIGVTGTSTSPPWFFALTCTQVYVIISYNVPTVRYIRRLLQNLWVTGEKFTRKISGIRAFKQSLSAISDVFTRVASYNRRHVEETIISSVLKKVHGIPRRFEENLSVLKDVFSRRHSGVRTFVQNLSVISDVFKRFKAVVITFPQNLSVISDIFVRKYSGIRKFVETVIIRDVFNRISAFPRKLIEDLSIIADKFTSVYTPIIVEFVRIFVENLSVLQAVFKRVHGVPRAFVEDLSVIKEVFSRRTAYVRKLPQTTLVQDVFKRVVGFPRKFIQNLSVLKEVFTRKVSYSRRLVNTTLVRDVFKRSVGFPRKLIQNLSVLKDVFARRAAYVRKFREDLSVIRDVFSFVYTALIKIYQFVEDLSVIVDVHKRIVTYARKQVQEVLIRDFFKRIYGIPRRLTQNLSVLRVLFARRVEYTRKIVSTTVISSILRRFVGLPRKLVEDLSVLRDVFVRRVAYLRKLRQNLSVIRDVFSFVYVPVLKVYQFVQEVIIQPVFVRRASYLRKLVTFTFVEDLFKRFVGFPRKFIADLSVLRDIFARKIAYLRRLRQNLSVLQDVFSSVYTALVKVYQLVQTIIIQALYVKKVSYIRKIVNATVISDIFKRIVGFPRRLIQNLFVISVRFVRRVTYQRKLIQTTLIRDVFTRIHGFPRKLIQNLSTITVVFIRKVDYLRRLIQATVVRDVFSYIYTPFIPVYKFVQNLSVIQEVYTRVATYKRLFIKDLSVIRDVLSFVYKPVVVLKAIRARFVRVVTYRREVPQEAIISERFRVAKEILRKLRQDLSVIRDVFSFVYKPLIPVYKFIQNLSVISDVPKRVVNYTRRQIQQVLILDIFKRIGTYVRTFPQQIIVSDIFSRVVGFPRRLIQNLSVLKAVLVRRLAYTRKIVNITVISDVLKRFLGLPRKFVEDLSILRDVFLRRIAYLRRLSENLSVIRDVFSFVYVPVVKVYKFVQEIIIQSLFVRRISYVRKLVNVTIIKEIFKRVLGFPRRFVQNLSVISVRFVRRIAYLRKLLETTLIREVFKRIVGIPRKLVQDLSIISAVFVRKVSFMRRLVQTLIIQEVFRRIQVLTRRLRQDLSTIKALFIRRINYLRRLRQVTIIRDVFSYVLVPLIKIYKLVQTIVISTIFQRRAAFTRRLSQNLSVLKDIFSSVYTAFVRIYRFVQNLSVIGDVFKAVVVTPTIEVLRRKAKTIQDEIAELAKKLKRTVFKLD